MHVASTVEMRYMFACVRIHFLRKNIQDLETEAKMVLNV